MHPPTCSPPAGRLDWISAFEILLYLAAHVYQSSSTPRFLDIKRRNLSYFFRLHPPSGGWQPQNQVSLLIRNKSKNCPPPHLSDRNERQRQEQETATVNQLILWPVVERRELFIAGIFAVGGGGTLVRIQSSPSSRRIIRKNGLMNQQNRIFIVCFHNSQSLFLLLSGQLNRAPNRDG